MFGTASDLDDVDLVADESRVGVKDLRRVVVETQLPVGVICRQSCLLPQQMISDMVVAFNSSSA